VAPEGVYLGRIGHHDQRRIGELYSRWSMAEQMESRLVMEALERTAEMATRWTSSSIRGKVRQNSVPE